MQQAIIGWDIGGAHLKAALADKEGSLMALRLESCELWKGLDRLEQAVRRILQSLPEQSYVHAVTMTGEMADLFSSRDAGVRKILATIQSLLPEQTILVYAGKQGFIPAETIQPAHYSAVASANWLASAGWAAQKLNNGLFVDIGSTTTDILLLKDGAVCPQGYTDYDRLISRTLVYTGIIRTPVMAIAQSAIDSGRDVGLMAEYFATMADVYRVTGELDERHDLCEAADGGAKSIACSARRLARMIGCDYSGEEINRWQNFAEDLKNRQLALIRSACERQCQNVSNAHHPLIGAGVGRFLVRQLAARMQRPYIDFSDLFRTSDAEAALAPADCAPAAAVACLAMLKT
jgi:(4-(4-[2-(gamma-L-glutamylamino)ethyl]phenoxymethyl)furan-2-yl)methanamine synthase